LSGRHLGKRKSERSDRSRVGQPPSPRAVVPAPYDWGPVAWKLLIVGGGWVSWESKPARLKSSPPGLAGQIRSASLPREGRPLVRLDDERGAFALSMQVLEEFGPRVEVS
jgi:hypothetical protein